MKKLEKDMPFFGRNDNLYICSFQCGAGRDAYLQIELTENKCEVESIFELQPMEHGLSKGVNPKRIQEAVVDALDKTNEHFQSNYFIRRIGYIPNDSIHYYLHGRIVFEIIKHLRNGGEFKNVGM